MLKQLYRDTQEYCKLFCLIGLLAGVCSAKNSLLFSAMTMDGGLSKIVNIDTESGTVHDVTTISHFKGILAQDNGISALDPTTNSYHYATNDVAPFIYTANLQSKTPGTLVYVSSGNVETINWAGTTNHIYVLSTNSKSKMAHIHLVSASSISLQFSLSTQYLVNGAIIASVVSTDLGIYYLGILTTSKFVGQTYTIMAISLSNFTVIDEFVLPISCSGFLQKMFYKDGTLYAGSIRFNERSESTYSVFKIDLQTRRCTATRLPYNSDSVIPCWTFSPKTDEILFVEAAPTGLPSLYHFDTRLMKTTKQVQIQSRTVPSSIELLVG